MGYSCGWSFFLPSVPPPTFSQRDVGISLHNYNKEEGRVRSSHLIFFHKISGYNRTVTFYIVFTRSYESVKGHFLTDLPFVESKNSCNSQDWAIKIIVHTSHLVITITCLAQIKPHTVQLHLSRTRMLGRSCQTYPGPWQWWLLHFSLLHIPKTFSYNAIIMIWAGNCDTLIP